MFSICFLLLFHLSLGFGQTGAAMPVQTRPPQGARTPEPPQQQQRPVYKPEDLCTIEGVVKNAATGEPLKRVSIVARPVNPGTDPVSFSSSTDAEGKFKMQEMEPGAYRISAEKPGFVRTEYGSRPGLAVAGTTLRLEKAQKMKSVDFAMTPQAVLTGRLRDVEGEPVQYAMVSLGKYSYMQGRRQMINTAVAQTNDLGEYRLFGVAPGRYYLSATVRNTQQYGLTVDRSGSQQAEEGFAPTFYPGTNELSSATRINVAAGTTLQGLDMVLHKTRTFRIRGKIMGLNTNRGGVIMVYPKDGGDTMTYDRPMVPWRPGSGEFEIRGIRPGTYVLFANHMENPESRMFGRIQVEVSERDVNNVVLAMTAAPEMQGTLRTATPEDPVRLEDISVSLTPRSQMYFGGGMGRVTEKGTFKLLGVAPDDYSVVVMGLPKGYYLKSARLGDTDVLESGMDLSSGMTAEGLELVISPGAAKISGSVVDVDDKPVRGATVIVRPVKGRAASLFTFLKTASTDQNGNFEIEGVAPGAYQMLSFEALDGFETQDPELFKEHETRAVKLELAENGVESRTLKVVVRKD